MPENSKNTPFLLYHYTTKNILIEYIFEDYSLKIGSFKNTNDPKENKFSSLCMPIGHHNFVKAQNIFEHIRFNEWNVLCLTMDYESKDTAKIDNHLKDKFDSFNRGSAHARMWSHYAENHTGVCLVLDGNALFEGVNKCLSPGEEVYCGPINYENVSSRDFKAYELVTTEAELESITEENLQELIRNHVRRFYDQLFLTKFLDWSSENEYRFLINNIRPGNKYLSLEGALKKVILGSDFHPNYFPSVTSVCERKNIPVYKVDWQNRWARYYPIKSRL